MTERRAALLRALVDHNSRGLLQYGLADPEVVPGVSGSGQEVDDDLQGMADRGWIQGDRDTTDPSLVWWARLRVTVAGLREIGDWPQPGLEYLPGPWTPMVWGQKDLPRLEALKDDPPHGDFLFEPDGMDSRELIAKWNSELRLREGGLIAATDQQGGLSQVRLTDAGKHAIDPPGDDPLVRARIDLGQGKKANAITAAVEEALSDCLHALATSYSVSVRTGARDRSLADINNDLRGAGAYGAGRHAESVRHDVEGWLKVRNDVNHGGGASVPDARIRQAIDGIEQFLVTHCP